MLKEGFLVKRVSAPEPLRTLPGAARAGASHLRRGPSPTRERDRPPAALPRARRLLPGGGRSAFGRKEGPGHRQGGESRLASAYGERVAATEVDSLKAIYYIRRVYYLNTVF